MDTGLLSAPHSMGSHGVFYLNVPIFVCESERVRESG